RDIPSRGTEVIYIFKRRDTRGEAVFPGADVPVLMLHTDCSLFALKSAHSSRLLPALSCALAARLWVKVLAGGGAESKVGREGLARMCLKAPARIWLKPPPASLWQGRWRMIRSTRTTRTEATSHDRPTSLAPPETDTGLAVAG